MMWDVVSSPNFTVPGFLNNFNNAIVALFSNDCVIFYEDLWI